MSERIVRSPRPKALWLIWGAVALIALLALWRLESARSTVVETVFETGSDLEAGIPTTAVSLYHVGVDPTGPLVVVTHGFAGSRQMMQYISRDLARAGYTVAAFDFLGQGRSSGRMSSDVTRIEGTTQQLVAQTRAVTRAVQAATGSSGPLALLGHSMATDIIVRAAEDLPDVAAIVAISMYSDAVTATSPQRLLVLSGAWETRLRAVALQAIAQVVAEGGEGETVRNGAVIRRAQAIPLTEHVGVLFAPLTLLEARRWLDQAFQIATETGRRGATPTVSETPVDAVAPLREGPLILTVLVALTALIWPVSRVLPLSAQASQAVPLRTFCTALFLPAVPALAAPLLWSGPLLGSASFGGLLAFFALWGGTSLAVIVHAGWRPARLHGRGLLLLLFWALCVFAVALDRYGAAFLPTGPRLPLMVVLLIGTVPFMLADRVLAEGARLWQRVVLRAVPVATLTASMMLFPQDLGLLFTVLPVMVLFYVVFGSMARAIGHRTTPETVGLAQGVILAWSITASTPLFAG